MKKLIKLPRTEVSSDIRIFAAHYERMNWCFPIRRYHFLPSGTSAEDLLDADSILKLSIPALEALYPAHCKVPSTKDYC